MVEPPVATPEYMTVRELAELLRLKERKVYDLAASGEVPCSRATGKLLFPADEIRAWIKGAGSGGMSHEAASRPMILLGSHDPLLDWAIRQSRSGLATFFDGSMDGLDRFVMGEGIAAGLHVYDAEKNDWNVPAVSARMSAQNAVLVHFAGRSRGFVLREDGPSPETFADLGGLRICPRQPEAGTARLFRILAERENVALDTLKWTSEARTEDEAVEAVRRGEADVTFGLEAVARSFGLGFSSVIQEQFALLVDRKAWFSPGFQTLIEFCRRKPFQDRAAQLGGYDVTRMGEVLWNA